MAKLRIVLADDHAVVREGLKALINTQPDMEVVGEAGDGQTAIEYIQAVQPDVVVMDISMPGFGGVAATEIVRQTTPATRVLLLSIHEDVSYVRMAMASGATGYVTKALAAEMIIHAIRVVATGQVYLDPTVATKLVQDMLQPLPHPSHTRGNELSAREIAVVRGIAEGYTNTEIAAQLGVSVKTIETHKTRAMEKLGVKSRAALVRYAVQHGWLRDL